MVKEGIQFRIRIDFLIQREIVTGLKYVQKTSRMGVTGKSFDGLFCYLHTGSNFDPFPFFQWTR